MSNRYHFAGTEVRLLTSEEFAGLSGHFPYRRNLQRSITPVHYCKLEIFNGCIQGTMKIPRYHNSCLTFQTFGFYLLKDQMFFIDNEAFLKPFLEKLTINTEETPSPNQLLLLLLEMLISEDVLHLLRQEEQLTVIEEGLLNNLPDHFYETIIRYQRQFSAYHAYYEQLMNMGDMLQADLLHLLEPEERVSWQLYSNRAERLHDHVELLREYLVQLRDLYMSQNDVRQNKIISILTVVTTIFLPLTLIAGWYGMNFPNMPEFAWKYGYPAVIAVSILTIVLEILYFRKKKIL